MEYLVVLFALILSMIVHEGGHLFAMIRHGIPVQSAGIGLGSFLEVHFPRFHPISSLSKDSSSPFVFTLSPILLGAYVEPTKEGKAMMSRLPYASKVNIYGAGPLANIVFGLLIMTIMLAGKISVNGNAVVGSLLVVLCAALLGAGLFRGAARVFGYVVPVIVALVTAGIAVSFVFLGSSGRVMGPVGIFSEGSKVRGSIVLFVALSIAIGLSNLLPLSITDGGRIGEAVLERFGVSEKWRKRYFKVGTACLILLVVFAFGSDIARLFLK